MSLFNLHFLIIFVYWDFFGIFDFLRKKIEKEQTKKSLLLGSDK